MDEMIKRERQRVKEANTAAKETPVVRFQHAALRFHRLRCLACRLEVQIDKMVKQEKQCVHAAKETSLTDSLSLQVIENPFCDVSNLLHSR